ncbi:MAG: glycosyltransferase [Lachnospiraceae bacterium]|nr:glycosyltransferase [Lachnospiraceae bacterium]
MDFSVCMIMKNEESVIGKCLSSLKDFNIPLSNIIIVDTGSTDSSVSIAESFGITPYLHKWNNDFSEARNYAASLAHTDYVLALDADEYITAFDGDSLASMVKASPSAIGQLICHNIIRADGIENIQSSPLERFYNRHTTHFEYSVHEQLVPLEGPSSYIRIPLEITHTGYCLSPEKLEAKSLRNIELLKNELSLHPENPYIYFQLGQSYLMMRDERSALPWFEQGLNLNIDPKIEYSNMLVTGYGQCLIACGENKKALELSKYQDMFGNIPEYIFMMGTIYMNNQMYGDALSSFVKCLSMKENRTRGITSYFAFHNLGAISEILGDREIAVDFYRRAGDYPRSLARLKALTEE